MSDYPDIYGVPMRTRPEHEEPVDGGSTGSSQRLSPYLDISAGLWRDTSVIVSRPLYEMITISIEDLLLPSFRSRVLDLPIDQVAIFRETDNSIAVWAFCDQLEAEEANIFYNNMVEYKMQFRNVPIDLRLIELRGRNPEDFGISLDQLRPIRGLTDARSGTTSVPS